MSEKQTNKSQNPYLDGRREWNERYGDYIAQAKNWRLVAIISLIITVVAVLGNVYIGSQSKIKPFLVAVDKIGTPIDATPVLDLKVDEKIVKYALADFIINLRTVYKADLVTQKKMIYKTYNYLSTTLPAYAQITEQIQKNSPFKNPFDRQIEVVSILALGEQQYQVDWIEKTMKQTGETISIEKYRATVNYILSEPKTEADIMKNPIGLFIKDISFQKTLN